MTQEAAETREAILLARGVCRLFDAMGHACLTEVTVRNGRRADVLAMDARGRFTIVEVKTSLADFRSDAKWPQYLEFCDCYYFAVPRHFPRDVLPGEHGLIVADAWDATIQRPAQEAAMHASRRKAQTLFFGQLAARRLRLLLDPPV